MSEVSTFDFTRVMTPRRLRTFADLVTEMSDQIGFRVSSRGWCYLLEQEGAINKDQFNKVEAWVNKCRRTGMLPIDFVAEEAAREFQGVEKPADVTPVQDLGLWVDHAIRSGDLYDVDWWRNEDFYIQMVVEKIDLVTLFKPVCAEYHIPIANSKGWSSMLQRAEYARRFRKAEDEGLSCVLLYCGDHDPAGLQISNFMRKNLRDLQHVVWADGEPGYDPSELAIERFGLNSDFIEEHDFTWIENLITGGGQNLANPRHRHHNMTYVQTYLDDFGEQKCEANVLVTQPRVARDLCRSSIERYLGDDALNRFQRRRQDVLDYMEEFDDRTNVLTNLRDALAHVNNEHDVMGDDFWEG
jgi:hypothetical protein